MTTRLTPAPNKSASGRRIALAAFGGFAFGYVVRKGPWRQSPGFQDILATVSLLAMFGLVVETILIVFVNPTVVNRIDPLMFEVILTAVVAFYFGARS